jgi:hypothetical protein
MTITSLVTLNATLAVLVVIAIVLLLGSAIRGDRDARTARASVPPSHGRERSDRIAA